MLLTTILDSCGHETSRLPHLYNSDPVLESTYQVLLEGMKVLEFHLQDALLCHIGNLYVPSTERAKMILEVRFSLLPRNFG